MSDLTELLGRVEKATGPNYALEVELATALEPARANYTLPPPNYTASTDGALSLVERMLPGWRSEHVQSSDGTWWDCYLGPIGTVPVEANSTDRGMPTLPLAILAALLRALIAQQAKP